MSHDKTKPFKPGARRICARTVIGTDLNGSRVGHSEFEVVLTVTPGDAALVRELQSGDDPVKVYDHTSGRFWWILRAGTGPLFTMLESVPSSPEATHRAD